MADSTTSVSGSNPPAHCVINIAPEMAPHIDPMLAASRWSLLSDFERALEDIWQTTTSHEQNTPQADDIIQLYFESFDDAPAADSDPPPLAHSVYARTDTPDIGSIVDRFEYQASLAEASAALPDSPLIHGLPQSEEMSRMSLLAMPRVGDPVNVSLWDLATFSARRNWPPSRLEVEDRIVMPFQAHRTSASGPRVEGLFTCQHADSYDVHRIVLFSVFLWSDDHKLLDELAQPEAVDVSYVLSEKYSLQGFDQPSHRVTRHGKPGRVIRVNDNPTHGDSTLTLPRSDGSSVGSQSSLPTPVDAQGVISLSQFLDELDTQARTSPAIHATPQSPHGGPSRSRTLSMRPFGRPGTASSETIRSTTCSEESPAKVRFMEGLREVIPRAVLRGPHLRSKPHASEVQAGKPSQSVTLVDFLEEGRLPSPASAKIPRRHSGVPGVNSSVGVPRRARSFTPREPTVRSDPGSRAVLQFIQESDVRRTEKKAVNHPEEEGTVVRLDGYIQVPGLPRPRREWTSFERQTFLHLLIEHPRLSNEPGPGAMQPIHVEIPLQKELIHVHPVDDTIPSTMLFRDRASS
ncbi:hypothetical protein PUNSTDRAFT_132108 [Punctularia strigosozonata HHB-11173 SS5]|uniref:uncharacterized protein n=1 Tax=Punctularia strigosozonata (strain HHB-11173) TaxID=741275 RepID=UPI00044173EF|nr:uncharacterized protein PUNSTDRAFT_132108 [Punctularia strigosozonata HHB-11173 SS5]EIN11965.1 hypothetical protein PUNSTDRAFT_132108 [Punctularia strigosozonata HHB-11173 SS5]